jgi:hypothetical protein
MVVDDVVRTLRTSGRRAPWRGVAWRGVAWRGVEMLVGGGIGR